MRVHERECVVYERVCVGCCVYMYSSARGFRVYGIHRTSYGVGVLKGHRQSLIDKGERTGTGSVRYRCEGVRQNSKSEQWQII